ncbi:MAG: hypothetical protein ABR528_08755 [Pseudonocardiaceae bacterium]
MREGSLSQHRLAAEVRDDVRHDLAGVLHDVHPWVPGADYFGPVWVDGVGWVVPAGWESPHGWAPPPGWYQPAAWDHDDYRDWCNNHYSSDHDWRGWENCDHFQDHDNWHGWVPGADYFGPVWVDGVGWVVPAGWEPPHGWGPPPGWHQPAAWDHDDYREWCNNHYSSDHDWRGWENSYHWGEHNQWRGWDNDSDHRGWNDHDRDRDGRDHRGWDDHDRDDRGQRGLGDHDRDDREQRQDNGRVQHEARGLEHPNSGPRLGDRDLSHNGRGGPEVRDLRTTQTHDGQGSRGPAPQDDAERRIDSGRTGYGEQRGEPNYQHGQSLEGLQSGPANPVASVAPTFSAPAPSFTSGASWSNGTSVSPNVAPAVSAPAVAATTAAASVAPVNATPLDPKSSTQVASQPLSHSVQQAATVNTPAHQYDSDSRSGSPRGDESNRGVSVSQDSSQGSSHHSSGSVGGTSAGQDGQQNAHGATSHGQQGGATGVSGLDNGQHGGFTGGHGGFGGAPQADTGTQTDTGRGAPGQPSHPAAPQTDLGGSSSSGAVSGQGTHSIGTTSQPSHPSTPTPHGTAPGTSSDAPSTVHATATPQSTPTTHTTAPGASNGAGSGVHTTPTTQSTAPAATHSPDPSGGAGSSSSHGLSSGLTTHDGGQATTPATHDTTHGADHAVVPH